MRQETRRHDVPSEGGVFLNLERLADLTVNNDNNTPIPWDSIPVQDGEWNFTAGNSEIYFPKAGIYQAVLNLQWNAESDVLIRSCYYALSGVEAAGARDRIINLGSGNALVRSLPKVFNVLDVTVPLEVYVYHNRGGGLTTTVVGQLGIWMI